MKHFLTLALALTAGSFAGREADAQTFLSHAEWDTHYRAAGGFDVNARVTMHGTRGTYDSYDRHGQYLGSGQIYRLCNDYDPSGAPRVRGCWQFGESRGYIEFTLDDPHDPRSFRGTWGYHGYHDGGYWSGSRLAAINPPQGATTAPQPVNPPAPLTTRPRPSVTQPQPFRPQPNPQPFVGSGGSRFPSGSGRPSGPPSIGDPGRVATGSMVKPDGRGGLNVYDSNGRYLYNRPASGNSGNGRNFGNGRQFQGGQRFQNGQRQRGQSFFRGRR